MRSCVQKKKRMARPMNTRRGKNHQDEYKRSARDRESKNQWESQLLYSQIAALNLFCIYRYIYFISIIFPCSQVFFLLFPSPGRAAGELLSLSLCLLLVDASNKSVTKLPGSNDIGEMRLQEQRSCPFFLNQRIFFSLVVYSPFIFVVYLVIFKILNA